MYFGLPKLTAFILMIVSYQCGSHSKGLVVSQQLKPAESTSAMRSDIGDRFTAADYEQHISRLKKQLSSESFTFVIQPPFVVIGDEPSEIVQQRAEETVKWTVDLLKKDYFTKDPPVILNIWLFKNIDSYNRHARQLFGSEPGTPYGYYSSADRALVMNIETGSGTLVHEIVHPFIEANFPACPAWFNEGLASLYEQSGEVDGHLHGYPNWRLPALQKAIRDRQVPSFKTLLATTTEEFYRQDKWPYYAQSRYLCYYLQEMGLLVKFYREFTASQASDPTGYLSLRKVLGESDMVAFQKRWEKFVLGLKQGYTLNVTAE